MAADPDAGKVDKKSVHYSLGGDHCEVCMFRVQPSSCRKVRGEIRNDMWCKLFKRERATIAHGGER